MADKQKAKLLKKILRQNRVRAKISGTKDVPRLSVFRSLSHLYVQLIDDTVGKTIVAVSDKEIKTKGTKSEVAAQIGELLASKAIKAGVTTVVFDKGGSRYHGRVKAVADGARKGGLKF